MAATKLQTVLQASGTLTVGTPITSSTVTLSTYDYATVRATITNGATGPTLPAILTVLTSTDNTTFYSVATQTAGITASTPYTFEIPLSPDTQYVKITFSGNTGQNVTVVAAVGYGTW